MSVRYKFKNTLTNYETINFEGNSISLSDFKRAVVQQKHLSKVDDDLKVLVAETKKEFRNDDELIPKNSTLIVSRVPRTPQPRKPLADKRNIATKPNTKDVKGLQQFDKAIYDLSKLNISEEKKIEVMLEQSAAPYNPQTYKNHNGAPAVPVPKKYRCKRCYLSGHWVKDCPIGVINKQKVPFGQRKAGIPRDFLKTEHEKENEDMNILKFEATDTNRPSAGIPDDLLCPICGEVFVDAVMIPCCGSSFCDNCVREKLIESPDNECPACSEADTSPESLIPNRYLRKSVDSFKSKGKVVGPTCIRSENKST